MDEESVLFREGGPSSSKGPEPTLGLEAGLAGGILLGTEEEVEPDDRLIKAFATGRPSKSLLEGSLVRIQCLKSPVDKEGKRVEKSK